MKRLLKVVVRMTKPFVQKLAEAYDLHVERPLHAYGQHALILDGDRATAHHRIPKSVYFNTRSGSIRIGENTVFGERVEVLTGKHLSIAEAEAAGVELHYVPDSGRNIEIGSRCYIGTAAIIIGPVKIGDGAVIGAGSVVTHDIPPMAFAAGVPAKVIRITKASDISERNIRVSTH